MKIIKKLALIMGIVFLCPYDLLSQGIAISSNAQIESVDAATIEIENGNFVNDGTYVKDSENITLSGTSAKEISGSSNTSIHNLQITNTSGISTQLKQLFIDSLIIASNSKFIIDTVKAVTVSQLISNNAGTSGLLIKGSSNRPNGTLIFHNSYSQAVQATIEMYSKAAATNYIDGKYSGYKWQFFGIPVRSIGLNTTFDGSFVRKFNEAGTGSGLDLSNHWIQLQNGQTLTSFIGYEVTQPTAKTFSIEGELDNSSFDSGVLAYTGTAQYPGQHLIGNPYTAAINISEIEFGSSSESIIENSVYLYNTGSLADWTSAGSGTASVDESSLAGQYIVVPKNVAGRGLNIPSQISSMQAFLVKVKGIDSNAWVKIPYPETETDTSLVNNSTLQRSPSYSLPCTRIDVKGEKFGDCMWIFTVPTCDRAYNNGWDGYKEFASSTNPALFAMETSGNYQVNSINDINHSKLGFITGTDSVYTFTFTHTNTDATYPSLYLIDHYLNTCLDISQSGTLYTFTSYNKSPTDSRFEITTTMSPTTEILENQTSNLKIISHQDQITITNPSTLNGLLTIYDITGKIILESAFEGSTTTVHMSLKEGMYIAQAKTRLEKVAIPITIE